MMIFMSIFKHFMEPYGDFVSQWATPKSFILFSDFPWNKPSSYWGTPHDYGHLHFSQPPSIN